MIDKLFQQGFFQHINQTNLLVAVGLLFSQTLFLPYLNYLAGAQQISLTLTILLWISTFFLLGCVLNYICQETYHQFINIYEFLIFPIFTMLTINQVKSKSSDSIVITSIILLCIGGIVCILNIVFFYSRKIINKNRNITRISVNYRLVRIIRFFAFIFLYIFNSTSSFVLTCIFFSILSLVNIFYSISKFSFQNVYQQLLTLIFSVASLISSIQGLAYTQNYTPYSFLGEITSISFILLQPSFMIDLLQLKYTNFIEKNIEMRDQHQMLAVFKIMKQIILKKNTQFDYSTKFKNKVYLSYEKMLHKSKKLFKNIGYHNIYLQESENKSSSSVGSMFNFAAINSILQEENVFHNLIYVRLMKSDDFFIWEFYIISMVSYKYRNFNKSISQFYKKRMQQKNTNFLEVVRSNILYENIMKFIPLKQNQYRQHLSITFYKQLKQLTTEIKHICKNQSQIVSMMSNSNATSITKYTKILCLRSQLKQKINKQIQEMTNFTFYIFSNNFLYTILLYKLFFQRQQKVLKEKILNLFVRKLAQVSKQNQVFLEFQKKSVIVCSALANGQILQTNQKFQKTYEPMNSKKRVHVQKIYISDILLSDKQKQKHQQLFAKASLFQNQPKQEKSHIDYTCYIYKYLKFNSENDQQNNNFIRVVDKVRIYTRIYFCLNQQFNYICTIQRITENSQQGHRVLQQQINLLQKKGLNPKILKIQTLSQLDNQFQCFVISLKQLQDCQNQGQQTQDLEVNCSQQFNFDQNQDLQEQKITKIQRSFNKEKQAVYKPQAIFIIAFIFILAAYVSFIFAYQNYKSNQLALTDQFINIGQQIIQNTLFTQKQVGLLIILYHYFLQSPPSQSSLCAQFTNVPNMTTYLQSQLLNFVDTSFNSLQAMYILISFQEQQLVDDLTAMPYTWYDSTSFMSQYYMDYFKYVAFIKNFIFDYSRPFQKPQQDFKASFTRVVSQMINQNQFQKTPDFYATIENSFFRVSSSLQTQFNLSNYVVSALAIILFLCIVFVLSKSISNQKNHLLLLKSLNKQYFKKRMKQSKFICAQLDKIQNSQYERIEIDRNMRIKIYKWNSVDQLTFQQIQHVCQQQIKQKNLSRNMEIQQREKNQNQKVNLLSKSAVSTSPKNNLSKTNLNISVVKSFLNLKYPLIIIFLQFFGILGFHIYDNNILLQKIQTKFEYYDVTDNINKVQVSMLNILMSQWLLYINQPEYKTYEQTMEDFHQSINLINTSNYVENIRTTFDNQSAYSILYSSYCDLLNSSQTLQCLNFDEGILQKGFAFLASMTVNDGVKSLSIKDTYPLLYQQEICTKLVMAWNYTIQSFGNQLVNCYQKIDDQSKNVQSNIIIALAFLTIGLLTSSVFLALYLYKICKKTRTQVLSMESKAALYQKYQDFRPFLNQIYYRKEE